MCLKFPKSTRNALSKLLSLTIRRTTVYACSFLRPVKADFLSVFNLVFEGWFLCVEVTVRFVLVHSSWDNYFVLKRLMHGLRFCVFIGNRTSESNGRIEARN